jgi:hypothetical protein
MRITDDSRGKPAEENPQESSSLPADQPRTVSASAVVTKPPEALRLIPWEDIWTSLRVARIRGNGEMIDVFYDTLFKEAVFDDDGAWAFDPKKR